MTATNFPAAAPLIGPDGRLSPVWFQFFQALFARTGGLQGIQSDGLQIETASGAPMADLAPVYAAIAMVEAMAAQAMATGPLSARIAELEARIDALGQPAGVSADVEAQVAAGTPLFSSTSQLTNDAGYLVAGSPIDGTPIGSTTPSSGKFTTLGIAAGATITGPVGPAATLVATMSYEYPSSRYYIGDGTGYSFKWSKRSGGATTDVATLTDQGAFNVLGGFGCNGKAPQVAAASGGTLSGVISALVANGILAS